MKQLEDTINALHDDLNQFMKKNNNSTDFSVETMFSYQKYSTFLHLIAGGDFGLDKDESLHKSKIHYVNDIVNFLLYKTVNNLTKTWKIGRVAETNVRQSIDLKLLNEYPSTDHFSCINRLLFILRNEQTSPQKRTTLIKYKENTSSKTPNSATLKAIGDVRIEKELSMIVGPTSRDFVAPFVSISEGNKYPVLVTNSTDLRLYFGYDDTFKEIMFNTLFSKTTYVINRQELRSEVKQNSNGHLLDKVPIKRGESFFYYDILFNNNCSNVFDSVILTKTNGEQHKKDTFANLIIHIFEQMNLHIDPQSNWSPLSGFFAMKNTAKNLEQKILTSYGDATRTVNQLMNNFSLAISDLLFKNAKMFSDNRFTYTPKSKKPKGLLDPTNLPGVSKDVVKFPNIIQKLYKIKSFCFDSDNNEIDLYCLYTSFCLADIYHLIHKDCKITPRQLKDADLGIENESENDDEEENDEDDEEENDEDDEEETSSDNIGTYYSVENIDYTYLKQNKRESIPVTFRSSFPTEAAPEESGDEVDTDKPDDTFHYYFEKVLNHIDSAYKLKKSLIPDSIEFSIKPETTNKGDDIETKKEPDIGFKFEVSAYQYKQLCALKPYLDEYLLHKMKPTRKEQKSEVKFSSMPDYFKSGFPGYTETMKQVNEPGTQKFVHSKVDLSDTQNESVRTYINNTYYQEKPDFAVINESVNEIMERYRALKNMWVNIPAYCVVLPQDEIEKLNLVGEDVSNMSKYCSHTFMHHCIERIKGVTMNTPDLFAGNPCIFDIQCSSKELKTILKKCESTPYDDIFLTAKEPVIDMEVTVEADIALQNPYKQTEECTLSSLSINTKDTGSGKDENVSDEIEDSLAYENEINATNILYRLLPKDKVDALKRIGCEFNTGEGKGTNEWVNTFKPPKKGSVNGEFSVYVKNTSNALDVNKDNSLLSTEVVDRKMYTKFTQNLKAFVNDKKLLDKVPFMFLRDMSNLEKYDPICIASSLFETDFEDSKKGLYSEFSKKFYGWLKDHA